MIDLIDVILFSYSPARHLLLFLSPGQNLAEPRLTLRTEIRAMLLIFQSAIRNYLDFFVKLKIFLYYVGLNVLSSLSAVLSSRVTKRLREREDVTGFILLPAGQGFPS